MEIWADFIVYRVNNMVWSFSKSIRRTAQYETEKDFPDPRPPVIIKNRLLSIKRG
jgi:hypothetical protein